MKKIIVMAVTGLLLASVGRAESSDLHLKVKNIVNYSSEDSVYGVNDVKALLVVQSEGKKDHCYKSVKRKFPFAPVKNSYLIREKMAVSMYMNEFEVGQVIEKLNKNKTQLLGDLPRGCAASAHLLLLVEGRLENDRIFKSNPLIQFDKKNQMVLAIAAAKTNIKTGQLTEVDFVSTDLSQGVWLRAYNEINEMPEGPDSNYGDQ